MMIGAKVMRVTRLTIMLVTCDHKDSNNAKISDAMTKVKKGQKDKSDKTARLLNVRLSLLLLW